MGNYRRKLLMATPKECEPGQDGNIWVYYETTQANQTIALVSTSATGINTMEIDGVDVTPVSSYTFTTAGRHLVKLGCTSPTYLFYKISTIKDVYWPLNYTIVGNRIFASASSGSFNVYLGQGLTGIGGGTGKRTFYSASGMKNLVSKAINPPKIEDSTTLYGVSNNLKIYVQYSSDHSVLNAYKNATWWKNYASQIYELNADETIPV